MRAWRHLGGDWVAQGTSEHVLVLKEARAIIASVHGDDVTVKASREDAEWLIPSVQRKVRDEDADDRRSRGSGQAAPDPQQNGGLWIEADPRHVKEVIHWDSEVPAQPPREGTRVEDNEGSIDPELGMYRAVAARPNYSQDRPDIAFAIMKLCLRKTYKT